MTQSEETTVSQFKCPSCGGNAVFDPEVGQLRCPFCDTEIEIARTTKQNVELDFLQALQVEDEEWAPGLRVFHCDNCGAETVLSEHTVADFCSFCGSSHIEQTDHNTGIRPALVVPFQVSHQQAIDAFKKWIKARYMAPGKLRTMHQLDRLTGIYIPYWTYDTDTYSTYTVKVGIHYYVQETYTTTDSNGNTVTQTRMVQKTRWHFENGTHREFFDDVLIRATNQANGHLIKKIEPFGLQQLVDYNDAYLSGFIAERYAVPLENGWHLAKSKVDQGIESSIESKTAGDIVIVMQCDTDYNDITYKHLLLPIWISSFRYNGKVYPFIINGQSGRVAGESPVSWVKVTCIVVLSIAFIAFLYFGFLSDNPIF